MKKKHIGKVILAIGSGLALVGCAMNITTSTGTGAATMTQEKKDITFVLDWTPNTNHTGVYVAIEKGFYEEEGLNVSVVQPPEGGAEMLVASGDAQFGISFQDTMVAALTGEDPLPIQAVATILQHNTSGIISRAGEGIDTPKGLEGKKYATWDWDIEKAIIKNVVERDGGDFSKVELIPSTVTDEVSALKSKQVDAIWIYYGWAGIAANMAGLDFDYFAFKDINPVFDYYTPVLISNNSFLEENPDIAKDFLEATKRGYEYAIENPKEAAEILCKASPELDYDMVLASGEYMSTQYKAEVSQWGYIDSSRWDSFYAWLYENGLITEEIPAGTGFSNAYLAE